jgi:hypothetical protein
MSSLGLDPVQGSDAVLVGLGLGPGLKSGPTSLESAVGQNPPRLAKSKF